MKRLFSCGAIVSLAFLIAPALYAQTGQYVQPNQPNQIVQGTQMRLVLQNGLSTSVARDGDPFTAVLAQPVYYGGQLILPAGAVVHGQVSGITKPKHFAIFRSQASMDLSFKSMDVDGREVPVRMSILGIYHDSADGSKLRKDVSTQEGAVVQEKRDVKGYVTDMAIGGAGGTLAGAIFSHVVRGLGLGLAGGAVYVIQKKGKDVELPAQTAFLVRLDSPVTVPITVSREEAPYSGGAQ